MHTQRISLFVAAAVVLFAHACALPSARTPAREGDDGTNDGTNDDTDGTDDVVIEHTGTISGRLCNAHIGAPLAGLARLDDDPFHVELVGIFDDEGTGAFRVDDVAPGAHKLLVESEDGDYLRTYHFNSVAGADTVVADELATCVPPDPLTTGVIVGRTCAGEGVIVVVEPVIDGIAYSDETNEEGRFTIVGIPTDGTRVVDVVGSDGERGFRVRDVHVLPLSSAPQGTVIAGDDENGSDCVTLEATPLDRAVIVTGIYDDGSDVERTIDARVDFVNGNPIDFSTAWNDTVLGDAAFLGDYVLLLIGDGADEGHFQLGLPAEQKQNLRAYVQDGGAVWTRGWSNDVVEQIWPEQVSINATHAAIVGAAGSYVATVADADLAAELGRDTVDVDMPFDFNGILPAASSTALLTVSLTFDGGAVFETPIAVLFADGEGHVLVTSFGAGSVDDDVVSALLARL